MKNVKHIFKKLFYIYGAKILTFSDPLVSGRVAVTTLDPVPSLLEVVGYRSAQVLNLRSNL